MFGAKKDTVVTDEKILRLDSDEKKDKDVVEEQVIYDERMTKRLVRKIDWHIMPVLVILYLLSFLDRTNIGNARLANLEKDLHMTGLNYNVSMMVQGSFDRLTIHF